MLADDPSEEGFPFRQKCLSRNRENGRVEKGGKERYGEEENISGMCKFQGCDHIHEPKCAVKAAVEAGEIHKVRYQNYLEMYKELQEKRRY